MKRTNLVLDARLLAKAGRILEVAGRGWWEGDLGAMRSDPTGRRRRAS